VFALFADAAARDAAAGDLAGVPGAEGWWIRRATLGGAAGG
jgi:hypothetical protein